MKKILKSAMLVALTAAGFTACSSEFDPGVYTPGDKQREEFAKNFTDYFGEVDPNGTWNAVQQGSVNVTVADLSQVMVYAKGLGVNLQLRSDVLNAGENKTIFFDAPKGVSEVYVIAKNKDSWQSKTVSVGTGEKVVFAKADTRAMTSVTNGFSTNPAVDYGTAHVIKWVAGSYIMNHEGGYTNSLSGFGFQHTQANYWWSKLGFYEDGFMPYPEWGLYYAAYPWPSTSDITTLDSEDKNNILAADQVCVPHESVTVEESLIDAIRNVVGTADNNINILKDYTRNISYVTQESGKIELTLVSKQTNSNNRIGYYYTVGEQTTAQLKACPKYVLIPNLGGSGQLHQTGDKFRLVYYGANYDEPASYEFPKGVTIHFFLGRDGNDVFNIPSREFTYAEVKNEDNTYSYPTRVYNDIYGISMTKMFFSDEVLNQATINKYSDFSSFDYPTTAGFSVMGRNCISFEDWPSNGSIDWNDAVFTIDAPFNDFDSFDEVQSFIIAMEDLGNTLDFDYNDAVIRVSQANTILKNSGGTQTTVPQPAQVTLMAAGGTLPIKLVYKDGENPEVVLFDEIHDAFGVSSSTPVNVNAPGGVSKAWVSKSWTDAPTSLSLATDASKFKFSVNNGSSYDVNVPTATKGESTVPLAFVIPDAETWEWPMENVNITTKYPDFGTWVADNNDADAQLWYNFQWGKTYSSTPTEDQPSDGELTPDSEHTTTILNSDFAKSDYVFNSDLFTSSKRIDITFTLEEETTGKAYMQPGGRGGSYGYMNMLLNLDSGDAYSASVFTETTTFSITNASLLNAICSNGLCWSNNYANDCSLSNIVSITITNYK